MSKGIGRLGLVLGLVLMCSLLGLPIWASPNGIPVASAQGTAIEVGDATLPVGESTSVDIWVRGFPEDGFGLGCYAIRVEYDPTIIEVTGVSPGDAPFDTPISKISADYVSITQFTTAWPGPTGDIRIADLELTCLGPSETTLAVTVEVLANTNGDEIPVTLVNGIITQTPIGTPALTPTPTATPTPPPTAGGGTPVTSPTPTPVPTHTHTPTPTPTSAPGQTQTPTLASSELDLGGSIDASGVVLQALARTFEDGAAKIEIPGGTTALTAEGTPLGTIRVQPIKEPPVPPADFHIVGLAYDFGPDGATFDPSATITLKYDPAMCPEGIAEEDLVIAYFDVERGDWEELVCTVDVTTHTVTAQIGHFTLFAILAEAAPPSFSLSSLTVSPSEITTRETVTISAEVTNTGAMESGYAAILEINDAIEETKDITLAGGATATVSFTVSKDTPGVYEVDMDGQRGEFTVSASPPAATNWPLVGGVIAAVVVIGLAIVFFVTRRRRALAG